MTTGVDFNDYRPKRDIPTRPKMIDWVMRNSGGHIKSETGAGLLLTVVVIINFAIAFWLLVSF